MKIFAEEAIIELTAEEAEVLLGRAESIPEMLKSADHEYRSFKDRVEHVASETQYSAERTDLIYAGDGEDEIARYDGTEGLTILAVSDERAPDAAASNISSVIKTVL